MKAFLSCLAVIFLFGCGPGTDEIAGNGIDWITDYRAGIDQARESNKAVMLFFTADWCPPCAELKKHVFSDATVIAASVPLVNLYIDVDENRDTMREYGVRGIPAIFFLKPSGDILSRLDGPRSIKNFVKHMQAAAEAAADS